MKKIITAWMTFISLAYSTTLFAAGNLKFDWQGKTATVTESIQKGQNSISIQYDLSLEQVEQGYIVNQSNLDLRTLNGQQVPESAKQQVAQILALGSMPSVLIDQQGAPLDIVDFDIHLAKLSKFSSDPRYLQVVKSPQVAEILYAKSMENWCFWVCSWLDPNISATAPVVQTQEIEFGSAVVPQTIEITYQPNYQNKALAKLTLDNNVGGAKATESIKAFVKDLSSQVGKSASESRNEIDGIRGVEKNVTVTAMVDPGTLRPESVTVKTYTRVDSTDGTKEETELKTFEFSWK